MTGWDAALVAVCLAAYGAWMLRPAAQATSVEIVSDSGVQRLDAKAARRVAVSGPLGVTLVEAGPEGARVVSSPCPNQVCVRSGTATRSGQVIACLPNRVAVRVTGAPAGGAGSRRDHGSVDAVAR